MVWALFIHLVLMAGMAYLGYRLLQNVKRSQANLLLLQRDIRALFNTSGFMGRRIEQMEKQHKNIIADIEVSDYHDTTVEPSYAQANKLAEFGASAQEIVETCGMSLGEAELLIEYVKQKNKMQRECTLEEEQ